jgi:A/G-specific adenine glycosylase
MVPPRRARKLIADNVHADARDDRDESIIWPLEAAALRKLQAALRAWFRRHARDLPWRENRDPYRIWVSEIMLQQTQVATVIDYFKRFIATFPTVAALAAADEQAVLRLWEGLGYYRRARQLHAAARVIAERHGGEFPRDIEAIGALPGIGRYTAGAVLSIAFDARRPILEANTIRLLARLVAFRGDPHGNAGQALLWRVAEEILPRAGVGKFNQALMELGALVCTPKEPRCLICPLADGCPTRAAGLQSVIPRPKVKPKIEAVRQAILIVRRGRKALLLQRQAHERWHGLWDFPRFELSADAPASDSPLTPAECDAVAAWASREFGVSISLGAHRATIRHSVTRFRITLVCHEARYAAGRLRRAAGAIGWFTAEEIAALPLNVSGRKIAKLIAPS